MPIFFYPNLNTSLHNLFFESRKIMKMKSIKIINQRYCKVDPLKNMVLNFFKTLRTKDFLLTSKQLYKVFIFMERYSCNRKDFLNALLSLVEEGFLRRILKEKKILYELNLIRFKMEKIEDLI